MAHQTRVGHRRESSFDKWVFSDEAADVGSGRPLEGQVTSCNGKSCSALAPLLNSHARRPV
jgi:hypothetical protein